MPPLAEQYDRIERYLQGALTPKELEEFNKDLSTDAQLVAAVAEHRELAETLAGEGIHKFRQTLKEVDADWKYFSGGGFLRLLRSPRNLSIAASLLFLLGFFAWLGLQGPNHPEIATANFEQLPLQLEMGSYEGNTPQIRNQAHQAYIEKDYAAATDLFLELTKREPFNLNNQLYAGISQLGNDQVQAAVTTLKVLADGADEKLKPQASWYLALAYLKLEDSDSAKNYLNQVIQAKGFNWERAEALLKSL